MDSSTSRIRDIFARFGSLPKAKSTGDDSLMCCCPAHEDRSPSLSVAAAPDRILLHCFAGCGPEAVCNAMSLKLSDLFEAGRAPAGPSPKIYLGPEYSWPCVDPETGETFHHHRRDYLQDEGGTTKRGKVIRWEEGAKAKRLVYIAQRSDTGPVVIVEGEKAADALAKLVDWTVIGTVGKSITPEVSALADCRGRNVLLWPDHLDGREHMAAIHDVLLVSGGALAVKMIDPARLGAPNRKGWDAADWAPPREVEPALFAARVPVVQAAPKLEPDTDVDLGGGTIPPMDPEPSLSIDNFPKLADCAAVSEPIRWIWKQRIQRGRLNLISGAPDAGKTMTAHAIAAGVSRGLALPDDVPRPPCSVVWIGGEDEDGGPLTVARLRVAGADPDNVRVFQSGSDDVFAIASICAAVRATVRPDLVVLDSHTSWFEESNDGQKVRAELKRVIGGLLHDGCTVLLICHWRKSKPEDGPEHYRTGGSSGGLVGAARYVLHVEKTGKERGIVQAVKHGSAPESDDVRFQIVSEGLIGRLEWEGCTPHAPGGGGGGGGLHVDDDQVIDWLTVQPDRVSKTAIAAAVFDVKRSSQPQCRAVGDALNGLALAGRLTVENVKFRNGKTGPGYAVSGAESSREQQGVLPAAPCIPSKEQRAAVRTSAARCSCRDAGTVSGGEQGAADVGIENPLPEHPRPIPETAPPPTREEISVMPIVTPPLVPDVPPARLTVEQIGDLAGPSPASGNDDATGPAWWPGLQHAEPGLRCVSCGAGPTAVCCDRPARLPDGAELHPDYGRLCERCAAGFGRMAAAMTGTENPQAETPGPMV